MFSRFQGMLNSSPDQLILKDVQQTFPTMQFFHASTEQNAGLLNILRVYMAYRPDMGYIPGMSYLAAMFLLYLDEYEAFCSFVNLLHSAHFVPFLRGDIRHIKWRLHFFD
mmetsp:Transcript_9073/g.4835  ORF Transcript_9073/g.4835 Transcript_9073/m.4835 type:complete len:110 (+) Transcript_9073:60-389(+)